MDPILRVHFIQKIRLSQNFDGQQRVINWTVAAKAT
jgi:hypothetical protein